MRFFRKYSPIQLIITCFLSFGIHTLAQETSQPAKIDTQSRTVSVNVLVTDSSQRAVTDLRQEEVRLFEDGKPQAITHFSLEELPVSYGVVVDASGSMRVLLNDIIGAGRNIVGSNKPGDETFVMRFIDPDEIQIEQGFTSNRYALEEALDNIYVKGGQTAVIDAINRSVDFLKKYRREDESVRRRQAIVLISDGEDRGSRALNAEALLNRLREEDVQFFILGLSKLSSIQGSREKATSFLTRVAEMSGGRAFFPKSPSEIPALVDEIKRDLHTQYVIGYTPTNAARDGSFRKVQVTVPDSQSRKKLNVITRPGYIAR
ncbi:MAG: Ca-activated chloride channel [Acidobacteriota bacterium]|jgi:Ca-activated chloride channel family protein|nr:Ca-activated chloride channel [Acidobacteriota bacterium]